VATIKRVAANRKTVLRTQSSEMPKINLIAPNPEGSKLIFFTPGTCPDNGGRAWANEENHHLLKHYNQIINNPLIIH